MNERAYQINGREVHAKVLQAKEVASGAIEVLVQTSCPAPDGNVHHQTNATTLTDVNGGIQLESFMYGCAEWLQKLLWEKPRIMMFVAKLLKPDGTPINLTCEFDITQPHTFIDPTVAQIAGLPREGTFRPSGNPTITFPTYRACLIWGKRQFETEVIAANVNTLCMIGSNLVLQAVGERREILYDLFLTDVVRALGNAARSKERTILILGSYSTEGREKLSTIKSILDGMNLEGVVLSDFADIHQQSLFEKMLMFGSLSRFIICDESVASGHLIELKACADIGFVTAILRNHGKPVTWMNADIAAERTYMQIFSYDADDDLPRRVREAVDWAQKKVGERAAYYNKEYPWRNPNVRLG